MKKGDLPFEGARQVQDLRRKLSRPDAPEPYEDMSLRGEEEREAEGLGRSPDAHRILEDAEAGQELMQDRVDGTERQLDRSRPYAAKLVEKLAILEEKSSKGFEHLTEEEWVEVDEAARKVGRAHMEYKQESGHLDRALTDNDKLLKNGDEVLEGLSKRSQESEMGAEVKEEAERLRQEFNRLSERLTRLSEERAKMKQEVAEAVEPIKKLIGRAEAFLAQHPGSESRLEAQIRDELRAELDPEGKISRRINDIIFRDMQPLSVEEARFMDHNVLWRLMHRKELLELREKMNVLKDEQTALQRPISQAFDRKMAERKPAMEAAKRLDKFLHGPPPNLRPDNSAYYGWTKSETQRAAEEREYYRARFRESIGMSKE